MRALSTVALAFLATTLQAGTHFNAPVVMNKDATVTAVAVADIDNDGALDVVAAVPEGLEIFYGDMRGGVRETQMIALPLRTQSLAVSDVNRDGFTDIIATTSDGVYNVLSSGRKQYAAAQRAGNADRVVTKDIGIGTVTMDGRSKALFVQIGNEPARTIELPDVVTSFAVADFDGDGKLDIAASVAFSDQISILSGDGSGGFTDTDSLDAGGVPMSIASGDIDRNGHTDVVVAYAKGIAFVPNMTFRHFQPAPRSREIGAQSLQPAAQDFNPLIFIYAVFDPSVRGYQWNDPNNWREDATGTHRVPTATDTVILDSLRNDDVVVIGSASVQTISGGDLSIGSPVPPYAPGNFSIVSSNRVTMNRLTVIGNSTLSSPGRIDVNILYVDFGASVFIDSLNVITSAFWSQGSLTLGPNGAQFFGSSSIGDLRLCQGLLVVPGTIDQLELVRPCANGGGRLVLQGTLNVSGSDFGSIQTNLFSGATINLTGSGQLNIRAATDLESQEIAGVAHLGAGTSLNLGISSDLLQSDQFTTDGLGTTVVLGLSGIMTAHNPLTVQGTLGSSQSFPVGNTTATGPVLLNGGSVVGHSLFIAGAGSTLKFITVGPAGQIDITNTMTALPNAFIGGANGGNGRFVVDFRGGNLTIQNGLETQTGVEFENDGVLTLQAGTLQVDDSPLGRRGGGQFNLAAGTKFVTLTPFALDNATVSGDGVFKIEGVFHPTVVTVSNLDSSFGDIDGGGLTITHDWESSFVRTVSGSVTLASGATMNAPDGITFKNAFVQINGTANLRGACVTNDSSFNVNFGGVANFNPPNGNSALSTCGSTGFLAINNNAKVLVNVTGRSGIVVPSAITGGTLEVSGGALTYLAPSTFGLGLNPGLIVDGGASMSFQSPVQFNNAQSTGSGLVSFDFTNFSGTATIRNPVNFNNAEFTGSGGNVQLPGSSNAKRLIIDAANTLTIYGNLTVDPTALLTNNGTIQIQNSGNVSVTTNGTAISGSGLLNNFGTITGGSPTGTTIDTALTTYGFFSSRIIANSGLLTLTNLTNIDSTGTLTGGNYEADSNSTLSFGSTVLNNAANLAANGPGARLPFQNLQSNSGTIGLNGGGTINASAFTNTGTVNIGPGSSFSANSYTQAGGTTTLSDATAQINAPTILQGGVLQGYGTITRGLQNLGGDLQPNIESNNFFNQPGTLTVQGNYSEGPAGHLHIYLVDQTHYSQVHVTGTATFAGTLQLDPMYDPGDGISFVPNPGDTFKVMTYASHSGTPTIVGQDQTQIPDFIYGAHFNPTDLTFIVETVDPKVLIANLETTITGLGLDGGTMTSLNSKLGAALSALQRGDSNAACGQLGAAVNFVNAQTGKKISSAQAAMILDSLTKIRAKVGCGSH